MQQPCSRSASVAEADDDGSAGAGGAVKGDNERLPPAVRVCGLLGVGGGRPAWDRGTT